MIDHTGVVVSDFERSKLFYTRARITTRTTTAPSYSTRMVITSKLPAMVRNRRGVARS